MGDCDRRRLDEGEDNVRARTLRCRKGGPRLLHLEWMPVTRGEAASFAGPLAGLSLCLPAHHTASPAEGRFLGKVSRCKANKRELGLCKSKATYVGAHGPAPSAARKSGGSSSAHLAELLHTRDVGTIQRRADRAKSWLRRSSGRRHLVLCTKLVRPAFAANRMLIYQIERIESRATMKATRSTSS